MLAVVTVEKARPLPDHRLVPVESGLLRLGGRLDVLATGEEVAGVEAVAGPVAQLLRHAREHPRDLLRGTAHRLPRPGGVLDQHPRAAGRFGDFLEGAADRVA